MGLATAGIITATLVASAIASSQRGGGGGGAAPTPAKVKPPEGPATIPDQTNFAKQLSGAPLAVPQGVEFGPSTTSTQQRAQIATGGTAGNTVIYRTPEVQRFYKDLAFRTLTGPGGNPTGSPLGVERQYAQQALGVQPRSPSTASFLSSLLRA